MYADDAPLRIALLAYRGKPHVGGQGVYVRHLSKALADLAWRNHVLAFDDVLRIPPRTPAHRVEKTWTAPADILLLGGCANHDYGGKQTVGALA